MITDKLEIEKLLSRLTTYIAKELHLSTMAAVGAVCMSKVANELAGGKIPEGTSFVSTPFTAKQIFSMLVNVLRFSNAPNGQGIPFLTTLYSRFHMNYFFRVLHLKV